MKNRILTIVAASTLLCLTTGCGTVRNFLFGRGAGCGLCRSNASILPQPASVPVAPPACGLTQPEPTCGYPAQNTCGCQTPATCGTCSPSSNSYGPVSSGYAPDPYSGIIGSSVDGGYIQGEVINGAPTYGGTEGWYERPGTSTQQSYKVDRDGARIVSEDPLPPGAIAPGI
ncbi:hypothetical protein [Stieleria varia]|uniref:Uncharacterized protein n=1 Tax=Stieleria varia TaxID=2528005 RepID=A0A5C6ARJ1_9BACT|nr:hypothetical protein [Stieleria varia]TWU02575.1 hypothetical protein Pla52n_36250 [Stieleria varia]